MSNIYSKVTIETFWKLQFFGFKNFFIRSVSGELQLTQLSLNFKPSCCNLKIRSLGAVLCVAFLLFGFCKELWFLEPKSPCILLNKNIIQTLIKTKPNRKWKIPHRALERRTLRFSSCRNCKLELKLCCVGAREKKHGIISLYLYRYLW